MGERDGALRHFQSMTDEKFLYFATHEVSGLEPYAVEIVREELRRRQLVPDPDATIDVQLRALTSEEFQPLVDGFRRQACPICGKTLEPLNAVLLSRGRDRELLAGCPACLLEELQRQTAGPRAWASAMLSPARAMISQLENSNEIQALRSGQETQALREYVWIHRGEWAHFRK